MLGFLLVAALELNSVQSVDYAVLHPGEVLIRIELARTLAQPPSGFRTFHPAPSVVLELPETSTIEKKTIQPERGLVSRIRLIGHAKGTRVVIDLTASATYEAALEGHTLLVTLRRTPPVRSGERWRRFGAAPPQYMLRDLRFERGPGGEGRVIVNAGPAAGIDVRHEGRRLLVHFLNAGIDAERRLDVMDFATPIEAIEARSAGPNAVLAVETGGNFEYSARQSDGVFVLTVAPVRR
jgi:type IV pilus assembly protein PilQ